MADFEALEKMLITSEQNTLAQIERELSSLSNGTCFQNTVHNISNKNSPDRSIVEKSYFDILLCTRVCSFEWWKPQVSILFLSKVIQKILTALLFWNGQWSDIFFCDSSIIISNIVFCSFLIHFYLLKVKNQENFIMWINERQCLFIHLLIAYNSV